MVARAAPAALAAATGSAFAPEDPCEYGSSFLFDNFGEDVRSDSGSGSGGGNDSNARKMTGASSSSKDFGEALDRGVAGGLCSRFFGGEPSRTSDQFPGAARGAAGVGGLDGAGGKACDGTAAADPRALQVPCRISFGFFNTARTERRPR